MTDELDKRDPAEKADRKTFLLRLDPTLWAEIRAWAASDLRSVNGQIEYILRQAVKARGRKPATPDT
jgi:hypothetical protein